MRLVTSSGAPRLDRWVEGVLILVISGLVAAARMLPVDQLPALCSFKFLTGYPCPACGMTRSWVHMAHGRFTEALLLNPIGALLFLSSLVGLLYLLLRSCTRFPALRLEHGRVTGWFMKVLLAATLLANWAYVLLAGEA